MGTLVSHIFPGTMFFFLGWWYLFNCLRNYHLQGVYIHQNVFSKTLEPLGKIILCVAGMFSQCFSAHWLLFIKEEDPDSVDWQHFTMYLLFFITGIFDLVCPRYGKNGRTLWYMSYIAAYLLESALFYGHTHDREILDAQCHLLITYSGVAVSGTLVYLLYNPSSIIASVLYSCLLVLHGIWFCEVGFIIYSPFPDTLWKLDNAAHAMLADVFFCWTFIGVVLLMLVIALIMNGYYSRRANHVINTRPLEMNGLLDSD
ncbi:transmembrane protein 45A-like [Bolinopsis microptera]|uniref:transmembrane protein 45A-like n=1 Tax=Bolinopsis microptera TaxID=2820187 RepID=UPI003079BB64